MKKIVWLVVSCLMALSLVMASCGPAEEEEEVAVGEEEVVVTEEEVEEEVIEEEEGLLPPEVPKYGGTYTMIFTDPKGFDPAYSLQMDCKTFYLTVEELIEGDWTNGTAGTGETSWTHGFIGRVELAESWEFPDDETIIYHIRPGVHWHDKPPANGREFTAEDAAWNIERMFTSPGAYLHGAYTTSGYNPTSIKALDKYTVEVKAPQLHGLMILVIGDFLWMNCPDVVEAYGDMKDWRNSIGTGPFMLTDYVAATSSTYVRNPNYWQYDPLHPENQLPYLDGAKHLYITDVSTQLAALRTGKLDRHTAITWEDAEFLMKQCPDLKYREGYATRSIAFRIDKPELPFQDINVRRALALAVNREELLEEFYGGNGVIYSYPYTPEPEFEPFSVPFEELPDLAKEAFSFDPVKARQLLADAGYPDGFKTQVVCGSATIADFLSIIKGYFIDIGVDMEIQLLESGTFSSLSRGRKHEVGISRGNLMTSFPFRLLEWRIESFDNHAFFDSERIRTAYEIISGAVGKDDAVVAREMKGLVPYMLEQFIQVWTPFYYSYTMWWPWVQNYHGEGTMGYDNQIDYPTYMWIDEALKKSMGY